MRCSCLPGGSLVVILRRCAVYPNRLAWGIGTNPSPPLYIDLQESGMWLICLLTTSAPWRKLGQPVEASNIVIDVPALWWRRT